MEREKEGKKTNDREKEKIHLGMPICTQLVTVP